MNVPGGCPRLRRSAEPLVDGERARVRVRDVRVCDVRGHVPVPVRPCARSGWLVRVHVHASASACA
eukprot:4817793-Pleurochrysis_carterae.AAC.2